MYFDLTAENNKEDSKFKVDDHVRIWKYQNIFVIDYAPSWPEDIFLIKKVKSTCCGHMLLMILKMKKLLERFTKKNCKKQMKKSL